MAPSQQRHPILTLLRYITTAVFCIVVGIPMSTFVFALMILAIPYTLYFWSSNCGIRACDKPIVQLYLDHFETLHPELAAALERAFDACGPTQRRLPASSWPCVYSPLGYSRIDRIDVEKGTDIKYVTLNGYKFTLASGFFMQLGKAGFARQTLMELRMHDVESEVKVDEKEKAEYRMVMHKLCSHRTWDLLDSLVPLSVSKHMTNGEGLLTPGKSALGFTPYFMRNDRRMDWVLQQGAVLVPMDRDTYEKAEQLAKFGLWKAVRDDVDLASATQEAYWQLVDLR